MGKIAGITIASALLVAAFIWFDLTTSPRQSSVYSFTASDGESITCTVSKGAKRSLREITFSNKTVQSARECVGRITERPEIAAMLRDQWEKCMEDAP